MRFDLPYLIIAICLLVSSLCSASLFFIGVPAGLDIGKQWFLIFAAFGIVAMLVFLKISIKGNEAVEAKPKLKPSMKRDPGPIVHAADLKQAKLEREPKVHFSQLPHNEWDKSFESVQNLVVEDEEVAEPPDYDKYYEQAHPKQHKSLEQIMAERKQAFYESQAERESSVAPSGSPTQKRETVHTAEPQTEPTRIPVANTPAGPIVGSGTKPQSGFSSLSYIPASSLKNERIAGASYYFEDLPEMKYFRASVFKPKMVDFKSTPDDPNSKAQVKLFGMNLKVTGKPKLGSSSSQTRTYSPEPRLGSGFKPSNAQRSLEDIRRDLK